MYRTNTTLTSLGFRARRIEPLAIEDMAGRADLVVAAQQRTTFLDQCAAEAFAQRWFPTSTVRRSTVNARVREAIAEHGPMTAVAVQPIVGHKRSAVDKALRELLEEGLIVVVGTLPTMGRPRIYGLPSEG